MEQFESWILDSFVGLLFDPMDTEIITSPYQ